ncbi:hypothetical protein C8Q69DRAFT_503326 [Paecilomyces variotii]|uniref:Uncharacterized protein n=1 Tax=Byssochlamys spectabilis TaxID=264951 RepID=A0A443I6V5_BYSSP|nr:hypothetical protein C8Q69DRAFT_503326 [Paecilomyces variotii]KAJ9233572.1 hypothetical protein DTO169E5_6948 [Paecilomyces variotii]KAJ9351313.1 hypothetical protein DTO280E4_8303 [Paecilomyces variotii]KAJ9376859.1 hypothetical protein DTO063F5_8543 [Paecilomyces variotii]RWQ99814.1 hypothetical protein C8Q69DRAFT_503326 [Paecilomyces variotii]
MAEFESPVLLPQYFNHRIPRSSGVFLPSWAASNVQYAENLLECSDEPIEYDDDDEDYQDNCFFFPEDCTLPVRKDSGCEVSDHEYGLLDSLKSDKSDKTDKMTPELPDIKMLDTEALSDLLEDNLSPPEITSILVFHANGALFAYGSPLPVRQLRNLSATYGAAYTNYAKNASSGNLTGVNPASHPSSFVTAQSNPLGDVGSIVFEFDGQVAVVTKIADKVLLAAVGPSKLENAEGGQSGENPPLNGPGPDVIEPAGTPSNGPDVAANGTSRPNASSSQSQQQNSALQTRTALDRNLETQWEIDRNSDLARLASLNLSSSPSILLALESKSAALARFLSQKLEDLESPEDF